MVAVRYLLLVCLITVVTVGCAFAPREETSGLTIPTTGTATSRPASLSSAPPSPFKTVIVQKGDSFSSLAEKHMNDPSMDWLLAEVNGGEFPEPGGSVVIPMVPLMRGGLTPKGYQTVPILCYHKFNKARGDLMTVTEKAFEEQMRFLRENGYRVISLDQFFDFLDFKRPIPKKSVVITMDDGWRSAYEIAFPILRKYGYPATLFVYTDLIVGGSKAMDWDMLREMSRHGIDMQCHTKTHRQLEKRAENESFREYFESIQRELTESSRIIKSRVGTEVRYLAYPYSDTNNIVVALVEKLGYRGAFTVTRGGIPFFVDPYRIGRSMVYGTFDLEDFKSNLAVFDNEMLRWN